ncbi:MAG: enoyl-CoA hydratase/isomerase family protein [Bdellovibrionales bacterium]|nr:enoyl-CoA hydratase/isomerase family protein [Bdellovibrionales bacterium]
MDLKSVRYSVENKVGTITIARPEAMNALNKQVLTDLRVLLHELDQKREVRACILTGEGEKAFVAGADIKEMEGLSPAQAREMAVQGQALMQKIEDLPFPVIAAVNGFALGGGLELALACDFMLASNKAKWGLPEVTLGLIPGYGGTQRLSRNLGRALARRVALSGEMFSAQQGYEWGLFTQLCEPADLMPAARKLAGVLATRAPMAMAWVKEAINHGSDRTQAEGLKLESDLFGRTFETKDHLEGIKAFVEKRPADFQGH